MANRRFAALVGAAAVMFGVIFCSGEDKGRVKKLVAECGADGYLLKDELLGKWIVDNAG